MGVWVLMSGSLEWAELLSGAVVALLIVAMRSAKSTGLSAHLATQSTVKISPAALVSLLLYLATFISALLRANLDMARRVLTPSLPIDPTFVEVETKLKSQVARMLLANSITLTPGTLSVDLSGERILVHWIDAAGHSSLTQATEDIAASFERHIAGFLR